MRIFQNIPLKVNTQLTLDEPASHHVARVLRAHQGDVLSIFNGLGGEYESTITHIGKKNVQVEVLKWTPCMTESPVQIELAQALARGEKMDWIIQKAVELGVHAISPVSTQRANVRLVDERASKRQRHWQQIAIAASEQSGRERVPEIHPIQDLSAWLTAIRADLSIILSPSKTSEILPQTGPIKRIALLIGPEGGLAPTEVQASLAYGFKPLNLGPRILRTETAPLAALSILQYRYGDLSAIPIG